MKKKQLYFYLIIYMSNEFMCHLNMPQKKINLKPEFLNGLEYKNGTGRIAITFLQIT